MNCEPIAIAHTCFREKFGIPRQPGLVRAARGYLEMLPEFDRAEAFRGLDDYSHLWLLYDFHALPRGRDWKATVRPPRLGGNQRIGVFATRSPFRPNPVGLSCVRLEGIDREPGPTRLRISGLDLLDGTPVFDIKPYVPYTDSLPDARAGFAGSAPGAVLEVTFEPAAEAACRRHRQRWPELRELITAVLSQDPRPAYHGDRPGRVYGMKLHDLDIRWRLDGGRATVLALEEIEMASCNGG